MHRTTGAGVRATAFCALATVAAAALAEDTPVHTTADEHMAPVKSYLMDPGAEIALAQSAAPAAISAHATILTLRVRGYEAAVSGTNGFTCLVERSWMSPFGSPEFWNPRMRAPVCYNPAATQSILPYTLRRTQLALAGRSREEMLATVRAALARQELPSPEVGAMSFMMSKDGIVGDTLGHWHSHLMFHVPKAAAASWGANLAGSPVLVDEREVPEPQTIFLVPLARWSDGTEAPAP